MERLQPVGNYRVVYLIESVIGVDIGSVATGSGHIPTQDKAVEEAVVIRHILVGQISSLGISGSKLGFDLRAGYWADKQKKEYNIAKTFHNVLYLINAYSPNDNPAKPKNRLQQILLYSPAIQPGLGVHTHSHKDISPIGGQTFHPNESAKIHKKSLMAKCYDDRVINFFLQQCTTA
jgi:hypothetical protein